MKKNVGYAGYNRNWSNNMQNIQFSNANNHDNFEGLESRNRIDGFTGNYMNFPYMNDNIRYNNYEYSPNTLQDFQFNMGYTPNNFSNIQFNNFRTGPGYYSNIPNNENLINNSSNILYSYYNMPNNYNNILSNSFKNDMNYNNNQFDNFNMNDNKMDIAYKKMILERKEESKKKIIKKDFLAQLYFTTNINKINNKYLYTNLESKQIEFNLCLNYATFLFDNRVDSGYNIYNIYIKKISGEYKYDYYRFINYDIKEDYNLLNDYKKELNQEEKKMIDEMRNECISENPYIKLFIFNKYCFLKKSTVSVYIPHLLKLNKKCPILTNFLLDKNITIDDFVIDFKNNENCLFINILKNRLQSIKFADPKEFGFSEINNGERGLLYSTIPSELIDRSILEIDLLNLKNKYFGGYFSEKSERSNAIIDVYINE